MAPSGRNHDGLLARVNFPLYTLQMLTSRHVLVAGGGGMSKTGVANGFEVYELYHNGERFMAEEVIRHETGTSVVMNCSVISNPKGNYLAVGQESHCQLYSISPKIIDLAEWKIEQTNLARRRKNSERAHDDNHHAENDYNREGFRKMTFEIQAQDSIQTDFTPEEPLQRVIKISHCAKLMATGGTDGHIRVWKFPKLIKKLDISAHSKELDDIDFSPNDKLIVSVAKDGLGIVWCAETGQKKISLKWNQPEGTKYLFKRCKFGIIEGEKDKCRLFTIANPAGRAGKQKGFLHQWDVDQNVVTKTVAIEESLSALAVRDDGRFLAIGTMFSGTVSVYVAFSMHRVLYVPGAHSMFVTGLEFLPLKGKGPPVSSDSEAAVLSISVDNRVCIHSLPYRHTLPAWIAILIIVFMLFLTFTFCSYLGL
uniref:Putative prolactin regulatory element-binding protein/protein transport protein sec12p n=1 Tax=Xenopsylla cheopis TaxID=163159 RepID=A0A6M2DHQ7_XENCH